MSTTDEIGSPNKLGKWLLTAVILLGVPSFVLSAWSLERFHRVVEDNLDKPWCSDMQRWIANAYAYSLRPEPAAVRYEYAANLYRTQDNYTMAGEMFYQQAHAFEDMTNSNNKYTALAIYDRLAEDYRDYPAGAKAKAASTRIQTMGRP